MCLVGISGSKQWGNLSIIQSDYIISIREIYTVSGYVTVGIPVTGKLHVLEHGNIISEKLSPVLKEEPEGT